MTTNETLQIIRKAGKPLGLTHLYNYFDKLGIAPIGARQRPQQYPPDTAERILTHLGFSSRPPSKPSTRRAHDVQRTAGNVISLKQLKKHQPKRNK